MKYVIICSVFLMSLPVFAKSCPSTQKIEEVIVLSRDAKHASSSALLTAIHVLNSAMNCGLISENEFVYAADARRSMEEVLTSRGL